MTFLTQDPVHPALSQRNPTDPPTPVVPPELWLMPSSVHRRRLVYYLEQKSADTVALANSRSDLQHIEYARAAKRSSCAFLDLGVYGCHETVSS